MLSKITTVLLAACALAAGCHQDRPRDHAAVTLMNRVVVQG
jgi:hypothetical protein